MDIAGAALRHLSGLRTHLGQLTVDGMPLLRLFRRQLATIESAICHAEDDSQGWGDDAA